MAFRFRTWLRRSAVSRTPRRTGLRPVAKLHVELLEDRTLLNAGALAGVADFSALQVDAEAYDPHSILVRFQPGAVPAASTSVLTVGNLADPGSPISLVAGLWQVNLAEGVDVQTALDSFRADPNVLYAEPNYRVYVSLIPNDPRFPEMYGLNNTGQSGGTSDADIDAPEAWDVLTGTGSVVVAVIDTGVDYTHPDLAANIWTNLGEANGTPGVDDDGNGFVDDIHGYDFANDDGDPRDDHGHGTHVSGTIGAVGNNATGVAGVIWDVQIMGVKFLAADGSGTLGGAIGAINYAVANGAKISNNSWGGGPFTQALYDAIAAAGLQDHLFIAAAGNDSSNNDTFPFFPAGYDLDNIIAVAATDRNDDAAFFTNFGLNTVDLAAPGVDILSTLPNNQYGAFSGTSLATPHVSGVAALVRDLHPDWTFQQVKDVILGTVDPVNSMQGITVTGGRLNATGAVTGVPPPDVRGPRVVATQPSGGINPPIGSVRLFFNESVDAATFDVTDVVSFTGPNGSIAVNAVQAVAGSNDRQFDVLFDPQTALGGYTLTIGPDVLDLSGNPMNQDGDTVNGEVPDDRFRLQFSLAQVIEFRAQDVPLPIFDFFTTISVIDVDQHLPISDLDVRLNITHTFDGDLFIHLISPLGHDIVLSANRGGAGNDFQDTLFDDEAAEPISGGSAPFAGSFQPDSPLAQVDGIDAFGAWQLWVEDQAFFDEGTLHSWSLFIQPGTGSGGPPVPVDDVAFGVEDTPLTIDVLSNDSDPDGDILTVVSATNGGSGVVVVNPDNTITYFPLPNFNGQDTFSYTISDGGFQATGFVTVNLDAVNDRPVAVDDFVVAQMNRPITLDFILLLNDFDADFDFLSITQVGNAVHGTVGFDINGSVVFTPEADYVGPASFDYTISDGLLSDVGRVHVNVENRVYFSTTTGGTLTGSDGVSLSFADADIVRLIVDGSGHRFVLYFDGSDVGLTTNNEDIDAFYLDSSGQFFISTVGAFSVPRPGGGSITGGGEDVLVFNPTQLGSTTTGSWDLYIDGSDVGLDTAGERLDAIARLFDGTLLLSTTGFASVPGLTGQDEDLLAFGPSSTGPDSSGTWSPYFDGTGVGLADGDNEDVDALFIDTTTDLFLPTLHFSTRGDFNVVVVSGANEDIFVFLPTELGTNTSGAFDPDLYLDGSLYGLANFDLDGIHLGLAPMDDSLSGSSRPPGGLSMQSAGPAGRRGSGGAGADGISLFQALPPGDTPPPTRAPTFTSPQDPGAFSPVLPDGSRSGPASAEPRLRPPTTPAWAAGWDALFADPLTAQTAAPSWLA